MKNIKEVRRLAVKVGSSTLTHETGRLHLQHMEHLARVLSDLKNEGREVVLISSGAISAGRGKLGVRHKPSSIEEKQAMAAVGQSELMRMYEHFFSMYSHPVAQILLTRENVENETARRNTENTLHKLLQMGCIPIVNENDTVSFDEIEFGDNDTLSAYVAMLAGADVLINMSDIDGFYDGDPHTNRSAHLISDVYTIDASTYACAGGAGTDRGTGGVITKLHAAEICSEAGIPMYLVNGANPEVLYDIFAGKQVGTCFHPAGEKKQ